MSPEAPEPAVFLDRDGTLVDELGFLRRAEDLRLLPGAAEGVRLLNRAGWRTVLVTNQSGLARGLFDEPELERIHTRLEADLAAEGAHLDGIFFCPHHPQEGNGPLRAVCSCRKPAPGMILQAAARLNLDLGASWMVGDSLRDLESGRNAGLKGGVLVLTGKGLDEQGGLLDEEGFHNAPDLPAAARLILARAAGEAQGR